MKITLSVGQKVLLTFVCFTIAILGFMIKLPSAFRNMDKVLHAGFYFLAAAFLNILFARTKLVRHVIIFVALFLFGMAIEFAQAYSNRFFRKRIHGRFDPEDLQSNLHGLLAFSVLWLFCVAGILMYKKARAKTTPIN